MVFTKPAHEIVDAAMTEELALAEIVQTLTVDHGCHAVIHKGGRAGGSNFAFVDGGVRFLKYGRSTWPLNLWAVSDADRSSYAFIAP